MTGGGAPADGRRTMLDPAASATGAGGAAPAVCASGEGTGPIAAGSRWRITSLARQMPNPRNPSKPPPRVKAGRAARSTATASAESWTGQ